MTSAPELPHNKNMTTKTKAEILAAAKSAFSKSEIEALVRGSSKKGGK